jgi:hypothetical protein
MEWNFEPEYDFSYLNLPDLEVMHGITTEEIASVYMNGRSTACGHDDVPIWDRPYVCVGFSFLMRPMRMLIKHNGEICTILNVRLANENDIEILWCRQTGIFGTY